MPKRDIKSYTVYTNEDLDMLTHQISSALCMVYETAGGVTFAQGVWAQALVFNHGKDIQEVD